MARRTGRRTMSDPELLKLLRAGKTTPEIVDINERRTGHRVAVTTIDTRVRELIDRGEFEPRIGRHAELIPWPIRRMHRNAGIRKALQRVGRSRAFQAGHGNDLPPVEKRGAESFLRSLKTPGPGDLAHIDDWVVHYEPQSHAGFWLVPRRDGVDTDLTRKPDEAYIEYCRQAAARDRGDLSAVPVRPSVDAAEVAAREGDLADELAALADRLGANRGETGQVG